MCTPEEVSAHRQRIWDACRLAAELKDLPFLPLAEAIAALRPEDLEVIHLLLQEARR